MGDELLPCPFCGEEAVHDTGISPLESVDWAWCNNPECPLHGELLFTVEQWNNRPDSKPYKFENPEHGWQNEDDPDAQLEWDSYRDGFNAAREHKGEG